MKAILIEKPGDESCMKLGETAPPALTPGSVRIRNVACGVNRADLLQRQGFYPPPAGASPILGLECAGRIAEAAADVTSFRAGERVIALLPGGGYAEESVVDAGSVLRLPDALDFETGAGAIETLLTVFLNVFQLGGLPSGGTVLVHGGGSGIGTTTIDLVKRAGGRVVATVGSDEKARRCRELGADAVANYRSEDWVEVAKQATGGRGVDVVLDSIGGSYLDGNLRALAEDGRLVLIGLMGGAKAELPLGALLSRRLSVIGSTLRTRSPSAKAAIVTAFQARFGADFAAGRIRPVIHRVFPLAEAPEAHRMLKASTHFGKVVLRVRDDER
ncbi:MAG: NAD(P)H-quinone oxidoreductase [Deltaproteobacteria bacterium]|nr:NAD(P)H-quinone oxidoreductase [Deltaproteobacteria bacterium]